MAHRFEIRKNKAGEFVAYFCHNAETIFWTEGYKSKASAKTDSAPASSESDAPKSTWRAEREARAARRDWGDRTAAVPA